VFNCFKKKENFPGFGEGPNFIPKWGIIVPHHRDAQGARNERFEYSEYTYGLSLSSQLKHVQIPSSLRF
jgi:hypothetical protein